MSLNPLQPLHSEIAYYGITHTELAMLTREQLLSIVKGESSLLDEVFGAHILAMHTQFDEKLERRRQLGLVCDSSPKH